MALLDGPVDLSHDCFLNARFEHDAVFKTEDSTSTEALDHGTHVASIIFARHTAQLKGIAPNCTGLVIPIFTQTEPSGALACSQRTLAEAIEKVILWAHKYAAMVINISGGALATNDGADHVLRTAISKCAEKNILVFAAAGNEGCRNCMHVPGSLPWVVAVGAMDRGGQPIPTSNWGGSYGTQGVLAPGVGVLGAISGGGYACKSGTSFATPIVAGISALLLSAQRNSGTRPNPRTVRAVLLDTALGCAHEATNDCEQLLAGRLNPLGALRKLKAETQHEMKRLVHATKVTIQMSSDNQNAGPDAVRGTDGDILMASGAALSQSLGNPSTYQPPGSGPITEPSQRPVTGSVCSCPNQQIRQKVYVIGNRLEFDFGSRARELSFQDSFFSGDLLPEEASVNIPVNLLRYLLGWTGRRHSVGMNPESFEVNGHLYDTASVHWVLYQDQCPKYVVRPTGPFAGAGYKELLYFYVENQGLSLRDHGIDYRCLEDYLQCHGGLTEPLRGSPLREQVPEKGEQGGSPASPPSPPVPSTNTPTVKEVQTQTSPPGTAEEMGVSGLFGEHPNRVARIALAGEICGTARLSTGEIIEVLAPDMRGTAAWNSSRLFEELRQQLGDDEAATSTVARIVSRLYDETRNDGKAPEERAKNYTATSLFRAIRPFLTNRIFRTMLGGLDKVAVDEVSVTPSTCRRTGYEFDVEVSLFNYENTLRGRVILTKTVDVSDTVPVTTSDLRATTRR